MPTSSQSADRNLIFGLLALQMDFLTREQLLDALQAWMLQKQSPLGDILVRRGVLERDDRDDLDRLVARHVRRHGDPRASLAALRIEPSVRRGLESLPDPDVQRSVAALPPPRPPAPARQTARRPPPTFPTPLPACATAACASTPGAAWARCSSPWTRSCTARWR